MNRLWNDDATKYQVELCDPGTCTATLTASTLINQALCGTAPYVNALLYRDDLTLGDLCVNLLDTTINTTSGTAVGLFLNTPYTFSDPSMSPMTLEAGTYAVYGHGICDYGTPTSTGTFTIDFDFEQ